MPLGSVNLTSASEALKRLYSPEDAKEILYKQSPLFGLIKKAPTEFEGESYELAVQYGTQRGVAVNFASADANQSTNLYRKFRLLRAKLYAKGSIDRETLKAAKTRRGAFINALQREQKGCMLGMKERLEAFLYGNAGGSIARVGAISTNTITLVSPENIRWFQQDGVYELSSTDGTTGATRAGTLQCLSVNRQTGVVTFTVNVTTGIAAAVVGDFIFVRGDHSTQYGVRVLAGLAGWLPAVAPVPGDSFFGVDRSADPSRLAGQRFVGGGAPIEETLQVALAQFATEGAAPDVGILNPKVYQDLVISLGTRVIYDTRNASDAKVGFTGVKIQTPTGTMTIYADSACPVGVCYSLDLSTWKLYTLGEFPELINDEGLEIRRHPTADSFFWEYAAMGQLGCDAPGMNGVITL